jgi:hypothetical protein
MVLAELKEITADVSSHLRLQKEQAIRNFFSGLLFVALMPLDVDWRRGL